LLKNKKEEIIKGCSKFVYSGPRIKDLIEFGTLASLRDGIKLEEEQEYTTLENLNGISRSRLDSFSRY